MDDECWVEFKGIVWEYKEVNELTFLVNVWIELTSTV